MIMFWNFSFNQTVISRFGESSIEIIANMIECNNQRLTFWDLLLIMFNIEFESQESISRVQSNIKFKSFSNQILFDWHRDIWPSVNFSLQVVTLRLILFREKIWVGWRSFLLRTNWERRNWSWCPRSQSNSYEWMLSISNAKHINWKNHFISSFPFEFPRYRLEQFLLTWWL